VHSNLSPRTSTYLTSLQNKITSHKSHHYTSHHFTHLHSTPTSIPLPVTTFLTLFPKVFTLQRKDANVHSADVKKYFYTGSRNKRQRQRYIGSSESRSSICKLRHALVGEWWRRICGRPKISKINFQSRSPFNDCKHSRVIIRCNNHHSTLLVSL